MGQKSSKKCDADVNSADKQSIPLATEPAKPAGLRKGKSHPAYLNESCGLSMSKPGLTTATATDMKSSQSRASSISSSLSNLNSTYFEQDSKNSNEDSNELMNMEDIMWNTFQGQAGSFGGSKKFVSHDNLVKAAEEQEKRGAVSRLKSVKSTDTLASQKTVRSSFFSIISCGAGSKEAAELVPQRKKLDGPVSCQTIPSRK